MTDQKPLDYFRETWELRKLGESRRGIFGMCIRWLVARYTRYPLKVKIPADFVIAYEVLHRTRGLNLTEALAVVKLCYANILWPDDLRELERLRVQGRLTVDEREELIAYEKRGGPHPRGAGNRGF